MNNTRNYIDTFLNESREKLSFLTVISYQNAIEQFYQWMLESKGLRLDIKKVTPADIRDFKEHLVALKRQPATISKILTSIKTFFNWAVDNGHLEFNPAAAIEGVPQEKEGPKWLNKKEKRKLLDTIYQEKNLRNAIIIKLILFAGLQVSEIAELKTDQIKKINNRHWLDICVGETQKTRKIPLCKNLSSMLEEYLNKKSKNGYLFYSQRNKRLSVRAIQHMIRNYGKKAGIKDLNANVLRHTFGHELCQKGTDVYTVAILMGYSTQAGVPNIQTVLQYITDFHGFEKQIEKSMEDAVEKLDI